MLSTSHNTPLEDAHKAFTSMITALHNDPTRQEIPSKADIGFYTTTRIQNSWEVEILDTELEMMIDRNGKFDVESFGRNSQGWYWMVWRPERLPGTFEAVAMKARVLVIELESWSTSHARQLQADLRRAESEILERREARRRSEEVAQTIPPQIDRYEEIPIEPPLSPSDASWTMIDSAGNPVERESTDDDVAETKWGDPSWREKVEDAAEMAHAAVEFARGVANRAIDLAKTYRGTNA